jgi:hypothetical protein
MTHDSWVWLACVSRASEGIATFSDATADTTVARAKQVTEPDVARLLREVVAREMIDQIAEHIGGADAHNRATAFGVQVAGVIYTRYVLEVDPVATMPPDELVRHLAPGLHAALRGPRREPPPTRSAALGARPCAETDRE